MRLTKKVNLAQLHAELVAAGLSVRGLVTSGVRADGTEDVYAIDAKGEPIEPPAKAQAVLDAHVPVWPPTLKDQFTKATTDTDKIAVLAKALGL